MRVRELLRGTLHAYTPIVWLTVVVVFAASHLASPSFPSIAFARSILILGLFLAVVAFGQGLVMLTGGIDLSLSATVALGAFATGYFAGLGLPTGLAVLAAVAATAIVGAVIGIVVATTDFPAFIVTLAVGSIVSSLLLGASGSSPAEQSPDSLAKIFSGAWTFLRIPIAIWSFLAVILLGLAVQHGTMFGRYVYAIGNSPRAAQVAGVPIRRTLVLTYVAAAISYGVAGVMLLGYGSSADLNVGLPWLLPSITVVIVGGSSMKGGSGSYVATVGGVLLLTILGADISALGLSEGFKQALYGIIIVLALLGGRLGRVRD
jgi:ribose transport system permease protein